MQFMLAAEQWKTVMSRIAALSCFILLVTGVATPSMSEDSVGVRELTTLAPERGQDLSITVWYPADDGGTPVRIGESAIFEGVPARLDAPIAAGASPLVLVSHGGMRAAPQQSRWIASRLAARGYVVADVQPPALGPRDAGSAIPEIWLRPSDLAAALDMLAADPTLTEYLRTDHVAALGFFLGGTSALGLGGARLDADSFGRSCDENGTGLDCAWFAAHGVDLRDVDRAQLTRSNIDPRIKLVVAVDPELSAHFTAESLASVDVTVIIINLGDVEMRAPGLDASSLAVAFPDLHYTVVPDATPYSAFSRCKPNASSILAEEGEDDAICRESGGRTRDEIHAELAEIIADRLAQAFATKP